MKVLYDFEIDETIPREATDFVYDMVREFFIQQVQPVAEEIDQCLEEDDVAILISMHGDSLKTIPFNVPPHFINKLNECVTPEKFDAFQDRMIARDRSNIN